MEKYLEKARNNMLLKENLYSEYAYKSENAVLLKKEVDNDDIRPVFFRDTDRIIHSLGYSRYIDKTQVYSFVKNDHITRRELHVQLVSKIARTIGRSLRLNEDLIEAMSLGHDIGHTPFGHRGEKILNDICKHEKIGAFCHNGQSVRILKDIEKLNISIQTLDGILAHNGEIIMNKYTYNANKTKEEFLEELNNVFQDSDYSKKIIPMTLEGAVVRLSDVIAYIGRDIEDSIKIGNIKREDIPKDITDVLGNTNSKIVDTLIKDVIENSIDNDYLAFSREVFEALVKLLDWNYKNIYRSKEARKNKEIVKELFWELYKWYLVRTKDLNDSNTANDSEKNLLDFINNYDESEDIRRIIIDYIAGQTDKYFLSECEKHLGKTLTI